jgi:DNA-binding NarL/FixJ family response regulator
MEARNAVAKKKVVIVDDHPIVRQGIRALLERESDLSVAGEAEALGDALKVIEDSAPDIAIIDIALKGSDGLELIKSIRYTDKELPILVMSMYEEALYAERVLRAGANGYIMKESVNDSIVKAVRQVLGGDIYFSDAARLRILQGVAGAREDDGDSPVDRLSDRELEVFRLIGNGKGTRQIADQLSLSVKTIETYRAHIKEKLNLENASELVQSAVQWVENQKSA